MYTNAHTHLELSALAELCPTGQEFGAWLQTMLARRMQLDNATLERGIHSAIEQLHHNQTTTVGDISATRLSIEPLLNSGLAGVVYLEVLGFDPKVASERFRAAQREIDSWRKRENAMKIGLSIHAPYSCAPSLFEAAARWCQDEALPLAIHIAESPAEVAFLQQGIGGLRELNRRITPHIEWQAPQCSPIAYLEQLGVLEAQPVLVHAVQVYADDLALIAKYDCAVVHCPRSNHNLLCGRMPLEQMLAHGIRVGLGTDSLTSAQSLDMRDEVAFAQQLHAYKVEPALIEQLATQASILA
ncbi:amidohydrolase family protein [Herpetosiphon llansteffanensis]|uniref:amidohydrolase family protein n=1 Tax=Herpetosiphon llansteffanensis TaxID=2094568 RepID=UPI000D7CC3C8|nr:amidohydrolase family protein [Herpetosiphon llansteffanensis]